MSQAGSAQAQASATGYGFYGSEGSDYQFVTDAEPISKNNTEKSVKGTNLGF